MHELTLALLQQDLAHCPNVFVSHFLFLRSVFLELGMKVSVAILCETSICTALLARQVNIAPKRFTSLRLTFVLDGPNMSTAQYVKCAVS